MTSTALPPADRSTARSTDRSSDRSSDRPSADGLADRLAAQPVWRVGAVTGVVASVAAMLTAIAAKALGVPMEAAPASEPAAIALPMEGFLLSGLIATALGTILAVVLARKASHPAKVFVITTLVLTVMSFALPHTTQYATIVTRIALDITHVVPAAIFIPVLARRLARP